MRRKDARSAVLSAYGGKCACCGEAAEPFLVIDHVNNDGAAHRMRLFGRPNSAGQTFYLYLVDSGFPTDPPLQVLCANCNLAKAKGRCPHDRPKVTGHEGFRESDSVKTKRAAIEAYGGRCYCCGVDELNFLALDHVNGDGAEHRRLLKEEGLCKGSGEHFYRYLRRFGWPNVPPLRVACHNCNSATTYGRTCPHRLEVG